jgi:hypothetical protein
MHIQEPIGEPKLLQRWQICPRGGGTVDARALTGSQSLSSDLVIANKSITILAGQTTLAMGSNRIVVQPGSNQFAFTGYSAGWGPDQSYTAGGTTLQYTGNGSAFKIGASSGSTNFIRLEDLQVDTRRHSCRPC